VLTANMIPARPAIRPASVGFLPSVPVPIGDS
jgi:hypothetical protein